MLSCPGRPSLWILKEMNTYELRLLRPTIPEAPRKTGYLSHDLLFSSR
ncbi:hypothetical protein JMJ77_0005823 [Colletotrichum scovillei]|uniref:Uncharacterized protein n=1 Tax=Colletotrichum scovillei TaxID=1209932 RepID=A0A9P7RI02_9PEZI|nr:hypothetical protein JMJ77_0005823 [Colletotrichum scovillei]KAG7077083.1 hypothetical protein JMJ76_0014337 [Colletotrichum scovillei]KAG7084190.1 hypothetical protein JMJ78_0009629 [Colletotrichum scovillei]